MALGAGQRQQQEPPALLLGVSPRWKLGSAEHPAPAQRTKAAQSPTSSRAWPQPHPRSSRSRPSSPPHPCRCSPRQSQPRLPVTVRVSRLQHIDGGGAGPAAVVGKPAPAAPGRFGGVLIPLGGEDIAELLKLPPTTARAEHQRSSSTAHSGRGGRKGLGKHVSQTYQYLLSEQSHLKTIIFLSAFHGLKI